MGLYIRPAPCVKGRGSISAAGIRWAIGPWGCPTASRCGPPGGSTGAGPVSVYWGLRRRWQHGQQKCSRRYSWRDVMAESSVGGGHHPLLKPPLARAGNHARAGPTRGSM